MAMETTAEETDQIEKLLADVRRTIRENKQFICSLKEDDKDIEEEPDQEQQQEAVQPEEDEFEEL